MAPSGSPAPEGGADPIGPPAGITQTVTIRNQRGLHARAAAKFVKLAAQFEADIEVARNDTVVCGQSIMGLMMLAASPGSQITLSACGRDAAIAITSLIDLIERKFDED
ncbi:MAG: HPr family phosphocarrier protein [Azospirillaceae bacterium]|nr:HPr family phosphocarrier protein [Azospirillaceae bacterium]